MNRNLEDNLIVNLKNEIYELKKENTELKQQLSQLQQENETLKQKLLKIIENIDVSYNEWEKWKEEISKLKEN